MWNINNIINAHKGVIWMFNKLFSFLGFNSSESYVGLSQLVVDNVQIKPQQQEIPKKELKLSDLMRGN